MAVAGLDQFDDVLVDLDEAAVERRVALQDGQGGQAEEGVELVHGVAEGFRAHRGEQDVVEGLVDGDEQVVVFFLDCDAGFLVQLVESFDVQVRAPQQRGRLDGGAGAEGVGDELRRRGGQEHAAVGDAFAEAFGGQHGESFTQRVAGNPEALGEGDLVELLPGSEFAT